MKRSDEYTFVKIEAESDIVSVRKLARIAAQEMGFSVTDVTRVVTAASELARNIYKFASNGIMSLAKEDPSGKKGVILVFEDNGPEYLTLIRPCSPTIQLAMAWGLDCQAPNA